MVRMRKYSRVTHGADGQGEAEARGWGKPAVLERLPVAKERRRREGNISKGIKKEGETT